MKYLNNFIVFNFKAFAKGKQFVLKEITEWKDFETKEVLGSKVTLTIVVDDTIYQTKDGEEEGVNQYEWLTIKVRQPLDKFNGWKRNDKIKVARIEKASVYGDYQNQLSIIGDVFNETKPDLNYFEFKKPLER